MWCKEHAARKARKARRAAMGELRDLIASRKTLKGSKARVADFFRERREQGLRAGATALLCYAARHRRLVRTRELASFAGLGQASSLALPLARCWLRSVYDDIAAAGTRGAG